MTRLAASARVTRMLSLVPWVAARGSAPIDEICQRFAIDREQLLRDLDAVSMVGLYPYTPDVLIELFVDEDDVHITLPQAFDRPLQLTAEQGLALVASGAVLLATPGADPDGPLARGLAKLAGALDADPGAVAVQLGDVSAPVLDTLRDAARDHHQVAIDYYAYGRDRHSHRVIDPHRVAFEQGHWYVSAWCHLADGERLFRVDRISGAEVQATTFDPTDALRDAATSVFSPDPNDPKVVLDLAPEARWVVETYPTDELTEGADGRLRVTLTISAPGWLERLLLGLGPTARVVEAPAELRDVGPAAATRVLARYRDG